MPNRLNPLNFAPNLLFVATSLILFSLIAVLGGQSGFLTDGLDSFDKTYSPWRFIPLEIWTIIAAIISLVLPLACLIVWAKNAVIRRVFLPYVAVLAVQILAEIVFRKAGFPGMSVYIGLIFTTFRVWQLTSARRFFSSNSKLNRAVSDFAQAIIDGGIIFWSLNWLFLVLTLMPQ